MVLRLLAFLSVSILCLLSCRENNNHTISPSSVIYEGRGVDEITLEKCDRNFLKQYFKQQYDSIKHGNYSVAIVYPQFGAHFYYRQDDDSAQIFAMGFDSAFKGQTSRGFNLNSMLARDMIRIYGRPRWQYLDHPDMMYAHYDSLGIYFAINSKDEEEPDFFADVTEDDEEGESLATLRQQLYYDSLYAKSRIIEISIGLPGTSF